MPTNIRAYTQSMRTKKLIAYTCAAGSASKVFAHQICIHTDIQIMYTHVQLEIGLKEDTKVALRLFPRHRPLILRLFDLDSSPDNSHGDNVVSAYVFFHVILCDCLNSAISPVYNVVRA